MTAGGQFTSHVGIYAFQTGRFCGLQGSKG